MVLTEYTDITQEQIYNHFYTRFIPNQNYKDAEIHLTNIFKNNKNTISESLIDFIHYHNNEKTVQSSLYSFLDTTLYISRHISDLFSNNHLFLE